LTQNLSSTHDDDAVPGGDGEDVGAGDDAGAHLLDGGLDGVDDLESPHGAVVRVGHLLSLEARRVVQQQRRVAALYIHTYITCTRITVTDQAAQQHACIPTWSIDPHHHTRNNVRTWTKQSWKKRRTMEAPMRCSLATADCTTDLTASYTPGHEEE
jgi:hypothetical protein